MEQQEYLDTYQQQLTEQLLRLCTQKGALDRQLLETPDLEERWRDIAAAYMADAVKEIAQYPDAALGWMETSAKLFSFFILSILSFFVSLPYEDLPPLPT